MSTKTIQLEKSMVVRNAEKAFSHFKLECHEVIKELDEVGPRFSNTNNRTYTVPRKVCYHFTYSMNGNERYLKITRKAGNSQTLETNIRKALVKEFEEDLKQMAKEIFLQGETS